MKEERKAQKKAQKEMEKAGVQIQDDDPDMEVREVVDGPGF